MGFTTEWFSNEPVTSASITYDLGSVLNIARLALWNEESAGIATLDLFYSVDGTNFFGLLSGITPIDHPVAEYPATVYSFATTAARYVRFDMSRCPQADPGTYNGCAIGEVAFDVVASGGGGVPEPSTGLLVAGAVGIGLLLRRRVA